MEEVEEIQSCPICGDTIYRYETRIVQNYAELTYHRPTDTLEFEETGWRDDNCIGGPDDGVACGNDHSLEEMHDALRGKPV